MKKIIVFCLIVLIGFLYLNKSYFITKYHIPLFSVPDGKVRVDFINHSNESIDSISLFYNIETVCNIKINERRTYIFPHSGEGTYQFTVWFKSGKKLEVREKYIEGGYFITETILNNKVESDY